MCPEPRELRLSCPAKVNLSLAILGLREDGFHALHSVVAQTTFGDKLRLQWDPEASGAGDRVIVEGGAIAEADNSVLRAINVFRQSCGLKEGRFTAHLTKQIPIGAGLGGGSSDAVATLKGIRSLMGDCLPPVDWEQLAAQVGSDCPLFLKDGPVLMQGRGDCISELDPHVAGRLKGQTVFLFKPAFPIHTAEAYRRLASLQLYQDEAETMTGFEAWQSSDAPLPKRINAFECLLESWIPSVAIVLRRLREEHGIEARLSGSGSACFAFPNGNSSAKTLLRKETRRAWGEDCWIVETRLN